LPPAWTSAPEKILVTSLPESPSSGFSFTAYKKQRSRQQQPRTGHGGHHTKRAYGRPRIAASTNDDRGWSWHLAPAELPVIVKVSFPERRPCAPSAHRCVRPLWLLPARQELPPHSRPSHLLPRLGNVVSVPTQECTPWPPCQARARPTLFRTSSGNNEHVAYLRTTPASRAHGRASCFGSASPA
jgi:hypothetical protein